MTSSVYTVAQICELLVMSRRSFYRLLEAGQLPMCEELRPRIGRIVRFRADLIDAYVAGQFFSPRGRRALGGSKKAAHGHQREHEGATAPQSADERVA